jgi:DNA-binding transcriptional LysR family regulator
MEINQLKHFVTVAKMRNFARAAAELNVTQSALSKSIKRLETFLGASVLERSARGVQLTIFGKGLIHYAQSIINERNRAIAMMSAIKGRAVGNVVIGVNRHLSDYVLPEAVRRVLSANPKVWVEVTEGTLEDLTEQLMSGEVDMLFVGYKDQVNAPALVYEKLLESDSVIVANRKHPLAQKASVAREDLMNARWILPIENSSIFQFQRSLDAVDHEHDPTTLPIFSSSRAFNIALLKKDAEFIMISPRHAVQEELDKGRLAEVKGPIAKRHPNIGIVTRRKGYRSVVMTNLMREIKKVCREI